MTGDEWLTTVRIARDLGSTALLLPAGVSDLNEIPHPIQSAIDMALTFIGWHEKLTHDEIPPKRIWLDGERLKEWFDDVTSRRDSGGSGDWADQPIEDPVQNGYAAELKRSLLGRR